MHRDRYRRSATASHACWRAALPSLTLVVLGATVSTTAIAGNHSTVVNVTAYNDVPSQTNNHPKTGAWSQHIGPGTVAVSPDLVARGLTDGTKVAIEGYKHDFVVRDKTASDVHNTVDIYMKKNIDKATDFGRKRLRIWWHTPDD